ncbi:MAG TPA: hypothetical protein VI731_01670 [Bacteroidia bacterium]|nr:hypothetical protein [Bacteroidia bacterium]
MILRFSTPRLTALIVIMLTCPIFQSFKNPVNAVKVRWHTRVNYTGPGQAEIHFIGEIPGGWRLYSQNMKGQDGALPTTLEFDPGPKFKLVGAPLESGKRTDFYQPELEMQVSCLEVQVKYVQHISFTPGETFAVKCMINYMLNRDGEILSPDDEEITTTINGN